MEEGRRDLLRAALLEAFAAASMTRERYDVYAARAQAQGYPQLAHLFRAAARGEAQHAQRHLKAAREVSGPGENLRRALDLKAKNVDDRYPAAREIAAAVGNRRAMQAYEYAEGADRMHRSLLEQAARQLARGQDLPAADYLVCKVCGYVHVGETPPDACPVCGSPAVAFLPVP